MKTKTELSNTSIQFLVLGKHTPSPLLKKQRVILYREVITVCSEMHVKYRRSYTLCAERKRF